MCGRFTLASDPSDLCTRFQIEVEHLPYRPRYNVAPTQEVLAVVSDGGRRQAEYMRWGLVPYWARDMGIGSKTINARAETLDSRPAFRGALDRRRRCLVLADGFFEWRKEGRTSTPMYVALKARQPFAMAGLWDSWRAPSGEALHSCTIVTVPANALVEPIHGRMPAILCPEGDRDWLDPGTGGLEAVSHLLAPYLPEQMEAYQVTSLVNSPANDGPDVLAVAAEATPRLL